jgi:hypothetical protein
MVVCLGVGRWSQFTVRTNMLLVPPLLQPTSPVLPLGVLTLTSTEPGPEITPVVKVTWSC